MQHFTAYIDEAGDEGFGKLRQIERPGGQSSWLILGAMLVRTANDHNVPEWKRSIREQFPRKKTQDLHWSRLNHDQRVVVSSALSRIPMRIALTLSHKVTIPGTRHEGTFKNPGFLYNYLVRWLLERLITACIEIASPEEAQLRLVFSKRNATNYETMRDYLRLLANDEDIIKAPRRTDWTVLDIDGIEVENHSKRAGLQLADCAVSAFFTALERNGYGNLETSYAERLIPNLLRSRGRVDNTGLTIVPGLHAARCDEEQIAFLRKCWSGQAPGS